MLRVSTLLGAFVLQFLSVRSSPVCRLLEVLDRSLLWKESVRSKQSAAAAQELKTAELQQQQQQQRAHQSSSSRHAGQRRLSDR
jgi:hypothetical protein